jgi:hypothetical protein
MLTNEVLYMSCGSGYFVSTSIGTWQAVQGLPNYNTVLYVEGADAYVAFGNSGSVWYSTDGVNFSAGTPLYDTTSNPDLITFFSMTYGDGKWVAVGMFEQNDGPFGDPFGNFVFEASS